MRVTGARFGAADGLRLLGAPLRCPPARRRRVTPTAMIGFDTFLPALGVNADTAVLASAALATLSVLVNFFSGTALEQKRAELALEVRRGNT